MWGAFYCLVVGKTEIGRQVVMLLNTDSIIPQDDTSSPDTMEKALKLLIPAGAVVEIRIPKVGPNTISGYFNDMDKLVKEVAKWSGRVPGIYITVNEVNPALLSRASNRARALGKGDSTTSDSDITRRRILPVDLDPVRPSGISSTNEEKEAAIEKAKAMQTWLTNNHGWPKPVLFGDSGNGAHIPYAIDLPNDTESKLLIQKVLKVMDFAFSDEVVKVDLTTFNASRIWKLYGTMACKGDSTPERPHRMSEILEYTESAETVTVEQLQALAALLPEEPKGTPSKYTGSTSEFNLHTWIINHGLSVCKEGPWQIGGYKWILDVCPFDNDHTDNSAYVVQLPNGAIGAGCQHDGCKSRGWGWQELRELLEPESKERREIALVKRDAKTVAAKPITTGKTAIIVDFSTAKDWKKDLTTIVNKKGEEKALATRTNIMLILQNDERLKGLIAKNAFINQTVIKRMPPWGRSNPGSFWGDDDDAELRLFIEKEYGIESVNKILDSLLVIAGRASFHPVKEYLQSLEWDGTPRIDTLLIDLFDAQDTPYTRAVTRKTFIGAVARIFDPGCKFDTMLTLVGPTGIGKSTLFRRICGDDWFNDGLKFNDMDSKTGSEKLEGYWILEIGELAGMKKTEQESVKSFLSCQTDIFRPAYGRRKVANPRQCIIVGSTNDELGFLRDPTGNRRFWPVTVKRDAREDIPNLDRNQIWAEAVTAYNDKEKHYLDNDMEVEAALIQESHMQESTLSGLVENFLRDKKQTCAAEVWNLMLNEPDSKCSPQKAKELNDIIRKVPGWELYGESRGRKRFSGYGLQTTFVRIEEPPF